MNPKSGGKNAERLASLSLFVCLSCQEQGRALPGRRVSMALPFFPDL